MSIRSLGFSAVLGAALFASAAADASVATYTDKSQWTADVSGPITNTTTDPNVGSTTSSITLDDGTVIGLDRSLSVVTIGSGWATWSGGYTGVVYTDYNSTSIGATVTPVTALGFEIEPDPFDLIEISLTLVDGSVITQNVQGDSGAAFYGWIGTGITSFTISSREDFAFGNFYTAGAAAPTPEPLTLSLMGAGLAGIGALRRRKARA